MTKMSATWRRKLHRSRTATWSALCPRSQAAANLAVRLLVRKLIGELRRTTMATSTRTLGEQAAQKTLSKQEILRYSRHLIMPEVGMEGQLKLKNAKVLLIGTGGLGAPLGLYLAAAGVGKLGLVDFDVVDFTNLQRQVTFGTSDVGKRKSEAARARLSN